MEIKHRDGFFASKAIRDRVFDLKGKASKFERLFHVNWMGMILCTLPENTICAERHKISLNPRKKADVGIYLMGSL